MQISCSSFTDSIISCTWSAGEKAKPIPFELESKIADGSETPPNRVLHPLSSERPGFDLRSHCSSGRLGGRSSPNGTGSAAGARTAMASRGRSRGSHQMYRRSRCRTEVPATDGGRHLSRRAGEYESARAQISQSASVQVRSGLPRLYGQRICRFNDLLQRASVVGLPGVGADCWRGNAVQRRSSQTRRTRRSHDRSASRKSIS